MKAQSAVVEIFPTLPRTVVLSLELLGRWVGKAETARVVVAGSVVWLATPELGATTPLVTPERQAARAQAAATK